MSSLTALAVATLTFMCALPAFATPAPGTPDETVQRGKYLVQAGLCAACHTAKDGQYLAGGRPLSTPFGTFYAPNITPDTAYGIGDWSDEEFVQALQSGVSPAGQHYYPAFPYTAYTKLERADILAMKRYLETVPPVHQPDREHELDWYVSWRPLLGIWKALYFEPGTYRPDPRHDSQWNRGAYLVQAAAHCAACHSPRGPLGAIDPSRRFTGTQDGPDGMSAPNITPDKKDGIGTWSARMLSFYLATGMAPGGDFASSAMAEVIDVGTSHLSKEDRLAIARYILSLPARSPDE